MKYLVIAVSSFITGVFLVFGMTVATLIVRTLSHTELWKKIREELKLK